MVAHQAEVELVGIPSGVHHQHSPKGPTSCHPNATAHVPDLSGTLGPLHRHHHFGATAAAAGAAAAAAAAAAAPAAAAPAVATAAISAVFVCFSVSLLSPSPSRCPLHRLVEHRRRREHVGHLPSSDPYPCQHSVCVTYAFLTTSSMLERVRPGLDNRVFFSVL